MRWTVKAVAGVGVSLPRVRPGPRPGCPESLEYAETSVSPPRGDRETATPCSFHLLACGHGGSGDEPPAYTIPISQKLL